MQLINGMNSILFSKFVYNSIFIPKIKFIFPLYKIIVCHKLLKEVKV
jgi:hypothetical protein